MSLADSARPVLSRQTGHQRLTAPDFLPPVNLCYLTVVQGGDQFAEPPWHDKAGVDWQCLQGTLIKMIVVVVRNDHGKRSVHFTCFAKGKCRGCSPLWQKCPFRQDRVGQPVTARKSDEKGGMTDPDQ